MALFARLREILRSPDRLVLDTNIWLDWLVFGDQSITPLKSAQREGLIEIVFSKSTLDELQSVLRYPTLKLTEAQREKTLAEAQQLGVMHHEVEPRPNLPRCRDPDDQKFLLLACDAAAQWLLTRDKALLKLHRRMASTGVRIGRPSDWIRSCLDASYPIQVAISA